MPQTPPMCIRVSTLSANLIALPNNRDPTSTNLNICTEIAIEPPGSKTSSPGPPQIPLSGTITHRLGHVHTSTASEGAPSPPRNNPHAYGAAVHAHSNPPALPDSKRERKKKTHRPTGPQHLHRPILPERLPCVPAQSKPPLPPPTYRDIQITRQVLRLSP